ncbi:MAG: CPBP family intramembrane metalloprotease [Chloroflexi bacterium]|nr:CPBP family intramembrane metalloprotease [Chloroflexota bacterium]MBI5828202.1 CPBP family intramembrane metalloprotease [Chloroflexota bacterium]
MTLKPEIQSRGPRRLFVRDGRLRWGWRLPAYVALLILCTAALSLPLVLVWQLANLPRLIFQPISMAAYLGGVLLATWLARRFLDKRPFVELGFQRPPGWWGESILGAALGGVLMLGIFAIETGLGWAQVTGFAWQDESSLNVVGLAALAFWTFTVVGVVEELYTRGYLMQTLAEGLGLTWAVLISSALFGLLHLANPNASWISTFNLVIAGVFLALGYVVTRRLWLPIGLHFGWNFFQGTVFGFPVSGGEGFTLIRLAETGPDLATGGAFGPEAGLTGLGAMAAGMALIAAWGRWMQKKI